MTSSPKYTPVLSRFPTDSDSSNDEELDRILLTPPDRSSHHHRVVAQGHLVPAHSPIDEFIGTPFSTSNLFEYPFNPSEPSPTGSRSISIATTSSQHAGHASTGSGSPSSPYYTRALREVSKEAPIPPSLREKVTALGA
ncbi:hypothetical protein ACGC1H_002580 [Rhizoctonia solani]|uniref:Uncharacterized protein n=1 Tax=Rhizoctonia solani TaxID=456999 RepID=A0A8H2XEX8_9AGAM|nr:unnamed protein product [Rhizoctonia solani]